VAPTFVRLRPDAVALKADKEAKTTHKKGIVYECAQSLDRSTAEG